MESDAGLRVALISTDYPPMRTSAAVQMRDLAVEMRHQGHQPVVIVPTAKLGAGWKWEVVDDVTVLRLAVLPSRDISYLRRTLSELLIPFFMIYRLRQSPFARTRWDLVAWYSPTIFFGPFIWFLRGASGCRTYLILRDIFPEWAVDLGLLRKGPAYAFFKAAARLQYAAADTIGVQTKSNLSYLEEWSTRPGRRLEVLHNWQSHAPNVGTSIDLEGLRVAGKKIVVYIGNMGVAQGMEILIDLAESLQGRQDFAFVFVGRGSKVPDLKERVAFRGLRNTLFFDEVDSREMPGLLAQCFVGLLALDPRHKTHNVPGKFLTYLHAGLPVLARVNPGTDLAQLIAEEGVGRAFCGESAEPLRAFLEHLAEHPAEYHAMCERGRVLAAHMFAPAQAVNQIVGTIERPQCRDDKRAADVPELPDAVAA